MAQFRPTIVLDSSSDSEEEFAMLLEKLRLSGKRKKHNSRVIKFDLDEAEPSSSSSSPDVQTPIRSEIPHKNENNCGILQNRMKILGEHFENFRLTPQRNPQNSPKNVAKVIPSSCPPKLNCKHKNEENFKTPKKPSHNKCETGKKYATPTHRWIDIATVPSRNRIEIHTKFLDGLSVSHPTNTTTNSVSQRFVRHFPNNRQELAAEIYKIFNETVFSDQLPSDMLLTWNSRLTSCAGRCKLRRDAATKCRTSHIELSSTVITNASQTRDTLIHEMCHAATFLINEDREAHGYYWKYWAARAGKIFPSLPPITRCHDYKKLKL